MKSHKEWVERAEGAASLEGSAELALLELAGRLADEAGNEEVAATAEGDAAEHRTLPRSLDAGVQQALEDLGRLVGLRRRLVGEGRPPSSTDGGPWLNGSIDQDEALPRRWGDLELLEKVGEGMSGTVYKARDLRLKRDVAVKLFHRKSSSPVDLDVLLNEGQQLARVEDSRVAGIHGAAEHDGRAGIWMRYIDGVTLQQLVESKDDGGGPRAPGEAIAIGIELCAALAAVHGQGLTHGDVKAQNVMRDRRSGRVVLMDFSSSRSVSGEDGSARFVGTPLYMAPELLEGEPSTPPSDLYALGVLLFYVMTGRFPYDSRSLEGLQEAVRQGRPLILDDLRSDLPVGLSDVVHKAIARRPEERYQTAGELQQALRRVGPSPESEPTASGPQTDPNGRSVEDVSTLLRSIRFALNAALTVAFLAFLGYLTEFNFNIALHVPEKFTDYSFTSAVIRGLRSLAIPLVLGILEILPIAVIWGLVIALGRKRARAFRRRMLVRLHEVDFTSFSTGLAITSVLLVAAAIVWFRDFVSILFADVPNLSLLRQTCDGISPQAIPFALAFSQIVLVLSAAWLFVFGVLAPSTLDPTPRFMRWASGAAILVGFVVLSMPWRLVWHNESPPIELGPVSGHVVAQDETELFVYAPGAPPGERHQVIRHDDSRITSLGTAPKPIFGMQECEEGVEP